MRNRIHNATNPHQGTAKKVLCVCSAGLLRSPTTANALHKEYGYNTRACGVNDDYALIILDEVLLQWADEVVFVEPSVHACAAHLFDLERLAEVANTKVTVLDLPDRFAYMDPELVSEIHRQYEASRNLETTV